MPRTSAEAIGLDGNITKNLRQAARAYAPIEFHLPESILGVYIALREKQVIFVPGINMRHAIAVKNDFNRFVQSF